MLAPANRVDSRCRMAMCLIYAVLAVLAAAGRTIENDRRTIEGVRGILDIGIMEKCIFNCICRPKNVFVDEENAFYGRESSSLIKIRYSV